MSAIRRKIAFRNRLKWFGCVVYAFCVAYLAMWFTWTLILRYKGTPATLNHYYDGVLNYGQQVEWRTVPSWQYIVVLPANLLMTAMSGLSIIPLCFGRLSCFWVLIFQISATFAWFSGLNMLFFGKVYGNYTEDFEVYMGGASFSCNIAFTITMFNLLRSYNVLELELEIEAAERDARSSSF